VIDRLATVNSQVEITTVVEPRQPLADGSDDPYTELLDLAKQRVANARPDAEITTRVRHGVPADEFKAASRHADLLVIGTNTTATSTGVVRATLAITVAGHADCTTVVVPATWQPHAGAVVVGWTADTTADTALEFGAAEAYRLGGGLTIVHTAPALRAAPLEHAAPAQATAEVATSNRTLLASATQRVKTAFPSLTVTQLMHVGSAAVAIIRAADTASLVVVGSRGRDELQGLLLGSVSLDVLRNMPAPVAVLPRRRVPTSVYPEVIEDVL
jgi:nucleotide-binding universal stress UspA family protein